MNVRWPLRREVVCQQWVELVTAYLDGSLPKRLHKAIDRHLAGCDACTGYLAQFRRTIELHQALPDEPVPDDLLDALTRAFEDHQDETATDL